MADKHSVRDPVTGRFIRAEPVVYTKQHEPEKREELITWKWVVAAILTVATVVILAYIFKANPQPTYIVIHDNSELAGGFVPEEAHVIEAVLEPEPETKKEAPSIKPAPPKKEIRIFRNGQESEVVYVD